MNTIRLALSLGLALAGFLAISLGTTDVTVMNDGEAQQVRAGQFTPVCFQNVSDCNVCTSNNTSCTQSGEIDACRLTAPPTVCAVLINPPACGFVVKYFMPACGGLGAVSLTRQCFTFVCA